MPPEVTIKVRGGPNPPTVEPKTPNIEVIYEK